jgi:ribonuclease Z
VTKRAILTRPSGEAYKNLKLGESVQNDAGEWINPEDVLGPARPGRRLCLLGMGLHSSTFQLNLSRF